MPTVSGEISDDQLRSILRGARRVAVVGLSPRPERPSHGVAAYLAQQGYTIYPVNPMANEATILGRPVYRSLADLPEPPDIIDVFRRSEYVPAVVDDTIARRTAEHPTTQESRVGPEWVLWTQLGVVNDAAAARARAAGFAVVQDRCLMVEHGRLGIGLVGAAADEQAQHGGGGHG